jgi:hypothetical protein
MLVSLGSCYLQGTYGTIEIAIEALEMKTPNSVYDHDVSSPHFATIRSIVKQIKITKSFFCHPTFIVVPANAIIIVRQVREKLLRVTVGNSM